LKPKFLWVALRCHDSIAYQLRTHTVTSSQWTRQLRHASETAEMARLFITCREENSARRTRQDDHPKFILRLYGALQLSNFEK
jgi:hypothetical protein